MNAWLGEKIIHTRTLAKEYGKLFVALLLVLVIGVSLVVVSLHVRPGKLTVSFLDIGQGDAILVQTPSGHDVLIDGGGSGEVLSRLSDEMHYFDRDIEVMIATHGDADHVTGLIPVLKKFEVKKIIRSSTDADTELFKDFAKHMNDEHAEVHVGGKGDMIDFGDGVIITILYPNTTISPATDTNDASVSIVVTYGEHSFLLTGDLSSKYEPQLIQSALPQSVTVYKAGHHGSNTSSGEQLLTYIMPEYSVVSAGKDNRYGHPHSEALERLEKYSEEVLSTMDHGTITFISDGRLLDVEKEK